MYQSVPAQLPIYMLAYVVSGVGHILSTNCTGNHPVLCAIKHHSEDCMRSIANDRAYT